MALFHDSAIAGASGNQGGGVGYQISRSLRFNSSDSAFCSRTPASAGNRKTWTWAGWVKRSALGANQALFEASPGGSSYTLFWFNSSDKLGIAEDQGGGGLYFPYTAAVFRDTSAWYHIVVAVDTTQATATNRIKIYVNGVQQTIDNSYPSQNLDTYVNSTNAHRIGYRVGNSAALSGYLADVHFIDGQALTPSSFTEVSATTGQLIPKAYSGTFGANGFHLPFSDNSTAAALGTDTSGNGNTWTVNNIATTAGSSHSFTETGTGLISSIIGVGPFWPRSGAPVGPYGPAYSFNTGSSTVYRFTLSTPGVVTVYSSTSNGYGVPTVRFPQTGQSKSYGYLDGAVQSFTSSSAVSYFEYLMLSPQGGQAGYLQGVDVDGVPVYVVPANAVDSLVDTPTSYGTDTGAGGEVRGNYCTWNPLNLSGVSLSNGNLQALGTTGDGQVYGTFKMPYDKIYFELTSITNGPGMVFGVAGNPPVTVGGTGRFRAFDGNTSVPKIVGDNWSTLSSLGAGWVANDIIGVAYDGPGGSIKFYKNGSLVYTDTTINTSLDWFPWIHLNSSVSAACHLNWGQRSFAYPVSGFKALCDTNLPAPVVAQPSTVMDVKLYTGNGSTQTISGWGFSPDFAWVKQRDNTNVASHVLVDIVRGNNNVLRTNGTDAENGADINPALYDGITNLSTSSFDVVKGSSGTYNGTNGSGKSYVAWCWDAGSSTTTNNSGSISSQVRANPSAGFSIVTYTGNGSSGQTIGHGLGVTPALVIIKNRTDADTWWQVHGNGFERLQLNTTQANLTDGYTLSRTSTTISPTGNAATHSFWNASGKNYVAYCFAPVAGYSSAFSYSGSGSSDGPFCFLGFRPRLILLKVTNTTGPWYLFDTARNTYNVMNNRLEANSSSAEASDRNVIDALSNGFKLRDVDAVWNQSGNTYVGFAWAESPFQYARAR